MADNDLAAIAMAMLGPQAQQTVAAYNPYYEFQNPIDQFTNAATQVIMSQKKPSVSDLALTTAVSGLLSGLFKGAGDDYQSTLMGRYGNTLMGQPAGGYLPEGLFSEAKRQRGLWQLTNAASAIEDQRDFEKAKKLKGLDLESDLISKLLDVVLTADRPKDRQRAENLLMKISDKDTGSPSQIIGGEDVTTEPADLVKNADELGYKAALDIEVDKRKLQSKKEFESQNWLDQIPTEPKNLITSAASRSQLLSDMAEKFTKLPNSAWDWNMFKNISGTGEQQAKALVLGNAGLLVRMAGQVGNPAEKEQARTLEATLGQDLTGLTSTPQEIAARINELNKLYTNMALKLTDTWKSAVQQGGDKVVSELQDRVRVLNATTSTGAMAASTPTPAPVAGGMTKEQWIEQRTKELMAQ